MTDDEKRATYVLQLQRRNRTLQRQVRALEEQLRTVRDEQAKGLVKVGALKGVRSVGGADGVADTEGVGLPVRGDGGGRVYRTDPLLDGGGHSGDPGPDREEENPSPDGGGDGVRDG